MRLVQLQQVLKSAGCHQELEARAHRHNELLPFLASRQSSLTPFWTVLALSLIFYLCCSGYLSLPTSHSQPLFPFYVLTQYQYPFLQLSVLQNHCTPFHTAACNEAYEHTAAHMHTAGASKPWTGLLQQQPQDSGLSAPVLL